MVLEDLIELCAECKTPVKPHLIGIDEDDDIHLNYKCVCGNKWWRVKGEEILVDHIGDRRGPL